MPDPNPSERLAEIEARVEAATAGPWYVIGPPWNTNGAPWVNAMSEEPHGGIFVADLDAPDRNHERCEWERVEADATLIAHARSDLPWLLEREKKLREAHERCCDETDYCYVCDCHPSHGHAKDCPLADSGEASGEATESAP